jgi:general stress protein 26
MLMTKSRQTSKEVYWLDGDTMYYSQSVTDPDYCILCFTADTGHYYSNFKSKDFKQE